MRLDVYLVNNGLSRSRATASEAIRSGCVFVNGKAVKKPSFEITGLEAVTVNADNEKYVSRGGYKLEHALNEFGIDVSGHVCVDIGASTGGFTDCLLQRGAKSVLAIDSGTDQLSEKIASDPRVTSLENTNISTYIPKKPGFADFVCVDVSFISLKLVFPAIKTVLKEDGVAVCLIKPQFEAGRENLGKGGVIKSEKVRLKAVGDVCDFARSLGFTVKNTVQSPITGGDGNIEYLCELRIDSEECIP